MKIEVLIDSFFYFDLIRDVELLTGDFLIIGQVPDCHFSINLMFRIILFG